MSIIKVKKMNETLQIDSKDLSWYEKQGYEKKVIKKAIVKKPIVKKTTK